MSKRKWKGKMTEDLTNGYGGTIKKGEEVVCWKKRMLESCFITDNLVFKGNYEYHYTSENDFVRTTQFLIEGQVGCEKIKNQK